VHESSGLKRMVRAFGPQVGSGQMSQLVVDQGHEVLQRTVSADGDFVESCGQVIGGGSGRLLRIGAILVHVSETDRAIIRESDPARLNSSRYMTGGMLLSQCRPSRVEAVFSLGGPCSELLIMWFSKTELVLVPKTSQSD